MIHNFSGDTYYNREDYHKRPPAGTRHSGEDPQGPLKLLTSGTRKEPSGCSQGTNTKIDDFMKKMFFISNSPCITYLSLFFTGRTNIQKF